jgi:transposase-like protein
MATTFMNTKKKSEGDTILKVDVLGRVRTPRDQRERILDAFEQSGIPGTRFAKEHGINYQTFATWIQRRRRKRGDYRCQGKQKKSVRGTPSGALMLAEVCIPNEKSEAAAAVRVELPGGASLTVTDASQTAIAAELIRQLSTRSLPC